MKSMVRVVARVKPRWGYVFHPREDLPGIFAKPWRPRILAMVRDHVAMELR